MENFVSSGMNWNELFWHRPDGALVWKYRNDTTKAANTRCAGKKAGTDRGDGRIVIRYKDKMYKVHRIIWEMHNGPIPDGNVIDHINGNPSDNRIENLRLATQGQNLSNAAIRSDNTSGLKGVSKSKIDGLWRADIQLNGKQLYLGRFHTKGLAAVARAKAAIKYHGQFARLT